MSGAFPLPTLSRDQPPAFTSSATCREWLSRLPLANPAQAQAELLVQLNRLNRFAVSGAERIRMLDLLREPLLFILEESAKRFVGRPLPLSPTEQAVFDANRTLLQAIATGYLHCLNAALDGDRECSGQSALVAQRALSAMVAEQLDHYRSGQELRRSFWQQLHQTYSAAEQIGVANEEVHDVQYDRRPIAARSVYVCGLLLHGTSPYELSARQISIAFRWLRHWSPLTTVSSVAPTQFRLPPLVVDLAGDGPATHLPPETSSLRWIDVEPLAGKLKRRVSALQRGASPESLGLGEDCKQPACEQLLRHVYEHCCKGGITRTQSRRAGQGECRLAVGLEAIHYYVSGQPFRQPLTSTTASKLQHDEIATFGRVSTRKAEDFSEQHGFKVETWAIMDETPAGVGLLRPPSDAPNRVARAQLVGVSPPGKEGFLLATTRWVLLRGDGEMLAGIRLIPGAPTTITIRPSGLASARDPWRPGFLLPAVAAVQAPASAVIPATWFRAGRVIDLNNGPVRSIRLTRLIDRGIDYERAEFEAAA